LGLRAPLILVGWGYDTCGQPVPNAGAGKFTSNHRQNQANWKAGPLSVNWNDYTKTWIPQPTIYYGTSQDETCDSDIEVKLEGCALEPPVKVKNPLKIPVGNNKKVMVMLHLVGGGKPEFMLVNSGMELNTDHAVCDLKCCEDGSLQIVKRDFYIHENPNDCSPCDEPDCGGGGGGGGDNPGGFALSSGCANGANCAQTGGACGSSCPCCDFNQACVAGSCLGL
jgi:hypothetical protein